MLLHYPSKSNKSTKGFSIDDLIKTDSSSPTSSSSSPSFLPTPITWLPPSNNTLLHFHRQSVLQYLRHSHPYSNGSATTFLLNSFRKPKRNRTAFTPTQLMKLEDAFEKNHYIVGEERKQLARHLNLSETKVKVWYQNRRTKHKRLILEDGNNSSNEIHQSETSDTTTKLDEDLSETDESFLTFQAHSNEPICR